MRYSETADVLEQVGKRIRECRKLNGMTQADLAAALGKSIKTVQRYESGKMDFPLSHLIAIANSLEVSLDFLVNYTANSPLEEFVYLGTEFEAFYQEINRVKEDFINKIRERGKGACSQ